MLSWGCARSLLGRPRGLGPGAGVVSGMLRHHHEDEVVGLFTRLQYRSAIPLDDLLDALGLRWHDARPDDAARADLLATDVNVEDERRRDPLPQVEPPVTAFFRGGAE